MPRFSASRPRTIASPCGAWRVNRHTPASAIAMLTRSPELCVQDRARDGVDVMVEAADDREDRQVDALGLQPRAPQRVEQEIHALALGGHDDDAQALSRPVVSTSPTFWKSITARSSGIGMRSWACMISAVWMSLSSSGGRSMTRRTVRGVARPTRTRLENLCSENRLLSSPARRVGVGDDAVAHQARPAACGPPRARRRSGRPAAAPGPRSPGWRRSRARSPWPAAAPSETACAGARTAGSASTTACLRTLTAPLRADRR